MDALARLLVAIWLIATPQGWQDRGIVLTATESWEQHSVCEPDVVYDGSVFRMWYRGGWDVDAIGYATSTDGRSWTKHGKVLGLGAGGEAGNAAQPEVVRIPGGWRMYYTAFLESGDMYAAESVDGVAWHKLPGKLIEKPAHVRMWGNRSVTHLATGWVMLLEGGPGPWRIYLATSQDGLHWSLTNGGRSLDSLLIEEDSGAGGPEVIGDRAPFVVYFQADGNQGNLPSDIYSSVSMDLVNWSPPMRQITHDGGPVEFDQVADPCLVEVKGETWMYYDADNNPAATASIELSVR